MESPVEIGWRIVFLDPTLKHRIGLGSGPMFWHSGKPGVSSRNGPIPEFMLSRDIFVVEKDQGLQDVIVPAPLSQAVFREGNDRICPLQVPMSERSCVYLYLRPVIHF